MEPNTYLRAVTKRWLVILILGVVGIAAAWAYASALPMTYESKSSVFVTSQRGQTTNELVQGSTFTQNLVQSYAQLATMPVVLDPVIEELGLDTTAWALAPRVTAETPLNTVIIEITVADPSATGAAEIADAITGSLATIVQNLAPKGPDNTPSITMKTVSSAQVATVPASPNVMFILVTGLLAGLVLGVAYALGRELLDTRVREEKDLERVTDIPLIGKVGLKRRTAPAGLVMRAMPRSPLAEEYRRICANLEFIDVDNRPRVVVVTSPLPQDGKSTTAANLALAMAERHPRVLLIDADLRRPSVADICGIEGELGLTTVLVGACTREEAITVWANALHVMPAGSVPPNPSQLLGSTAMRDLVEHLSSEYDFIVIDSPPLLPASDALGLAHVSDGAIVMARFNSTRRQNLAKTLESLEAVNARVLGVVLNQVRDHRPEAYYGAQSPPQKSPPQPTAATRPKAPEEASRAKSVLVRRQNGLPSGST